MRLIFARPARDDLAEIVRHIVAENPRAARAVRDAIVAAARRLLQFPRSGRPGHRDGTRELVVPGMPYLLVYTTGSEAVKIAAVLHAARDVPNVLDARESEDEP